MALVERSSTVEVSNFETMTDHAENVSGQRQTRTETPGTDTVTQQDGQAIEISTTLANTGTSTAEESSSGRTTTETKGPTTSRSIAAAHSIRTINSPGESRTVQAEDAVMNVEFTIRIRSFLS